MPTDPEQKKTMKAVLSGIRRLFPERIHGKLFVVGGSVRDFLLGKAAADVDLFAAVDPEELIKLGFRPVAPKSAVSIYFRCHGELGKVEVIVPESGGSLADDLRRRDFTVNALAMTLDGEIVDPLDGRAALAPRLLLPCSEETFRADPLRIFRALRFEAEGWRLSPGAEALIQRDDWTLPLESVPVERFTNEMLKALAGNDPARFFRRMTAFGAGAGFLPELFLMREVVAGPPLFHPEGDLLSHSLQVLERMAGLTSNITARLCAFFHDFGKLATAPELYPRHHGHDLTGYTMAEEFGKRLRLSVSMRRALMWTCRLHLTAARWPELRDGTRIRVAEEALKGGVAPFLQLLVAADRGEKQDMEGWETALQVNGLSAADLGIDPRLLAGVGKNRDRERSVVSGEGEPCPLPAEERTVFIRTRRIEEYRRRMRGGASPKRLR